MSLPEPGHIAQAVLFVASGAARVIHGAAVSVFGNA